jgi:inosine-uridine nucleoside N-ribohydrolase
LLSKASDHSITIITTGFFTNLAYLLASPPDRYSKLDGVALVRKKVKRLVSMAGKFPSGSEFNVDRDPAASRAVFSKWPTQIILSGFEIGAAIKTGVALTKNKHIINSPVKKVFSICIPKAPEDSAGRMSWDETAVFVAVKGFSPYYTLTKGRMIVAENGSDVWDPNGEGNSYLVSATDPRHVETLLNHLIMHQPVKHH